MLSLWKSLACTILGLCAAGSLTGASAAIARPGTVNYAEGTVTLNGRPVAAKTLGSIELESGQELRTGQGKAEMLLTPGVFLRLGDNSAVRMVSPSLIDTRVELEAGTALVEVDQIEKENRLGVVDHEIDTTLEKKGIYRFDADRPLVAVLDGKAVVHDDDRTVEVKKGKELSLDGGTKPQSFDRKATDELYAWSRLRSQYLANASLASAQTIVVSNPGWYGPGWFWNPWYASWAFVPGDPFLYSPFGFGFYGPTYFSYTRPVYRGYYPGYRPGFHGGTGFRGGGVVTPPRPSLRPAAPALGGSGVRFGATGRR